MYSFTTIFSSIYSYIYIYIYVCTFEFWSCARNAAWVKRTLPMVGRSCSTTIRPSLAASSRSPGRSSNTSSSRSTGTTWGHMVGSRSGFFCGCLGHFQGHLGSILPASTRAAGTWQPGRHHSHHSQTPRDVARDLATLVHESQDVDSTAASSASCAARSSSNRPHFSPSR